MMILSENGKVVEEPIKKSFLSALNLYKRGPYQFPFIKLL